MARIIKTKKGKTYYRDDDGTVYSVNNGKQDVSFVNGHLTNTRSVPKHVRNYFKGASVTTMDTASLKKIGKLSSFANAVPTSNETVTLPELIVTAPRTNRKRSDLTTKRNSASPTRTSNTTKTTVPTSNKRVTRSSSSTPNGNYTVNRGDSLWRIAHNNGMTLNELMRQNPQIKNINQVIHPGDKLNVSNKNSQTSSAPSTPKYEDIILDDTKMQPSLNVAPSTESITPPEKIAPISYNYKKKKR